MAKIVLSDLRPAGADLFTDSESFLHDLTETEIDTTQGGITPFIIGVGVGILISARYCKA
jgi:hypothetical protein